MSVLGAPWTEDRAPDSERHFHQSQEAEHNHSLEPTVQLSGNRRLRGGREVRGGKRVFGADAGVQGETELELLRGGLE